MRGRYPSVVGYGICYGLGERQVPGKGLYSHFRPRAAGQECFSKAVMRDVMPKALANTSGILKLLN